MEILLPGPDPGPVYADDPTDTAAEVMIEDKDFKIDPYGDMTEVSSTGSMKNFKSVVFKGYSKKYEIRQFYFVGSKWTENKDYIEYGENFSLLENTPRTKQFRLAGEFRDNKNIGTLVLRQLWRESDSDETKGYKFCITGTLNAVRNVFFDFHFSTLTDPTETNSAFTTNPESIYIREGNGKVSDWMKKLNVTDEKIFKIVAPK